MAEKRVQVFKVQKLDVPQFSRVLLEDARKNKKHPYCWLLKTVGKSTTGPPTNTWRLVFQSCTVANTNWLSSAFCVDVVALYEKQWPVFSLNSKSIFGVQILDSRKRLWCYLAETWVTWVQRHLSLKPPRRNIKTEPHSWIPAASPKTKTRRVWVRYLQIQWSPALHKIPLQSPFHCQGAWTTRTFFFLLVEGYPLPFSVMMLQCINTKVAHRRWNGHSSCATRQKTTGAFTSTRMQLEKKVSLEKRGVVWRKEHNWKLWAFQ